MSLCEKDKWSSGFLLPACSPTCGFTRCVHVPCPLWSVGSMAVRHSTILPIPPQLQLGQDSNLLPADLISGLPASHKTRYYPEQMHRNKFQKNFFLNFLQCALSDFPLECVLRTPSSCRENNPSLCDPGAHFSCIDIITSGVWGCGIPPPLQNMLTVGCLHAKITLWVLALLAAPYKTHIFPFP